MVQNTPKNGIPYPELSDPAVAQTAFANMLAVIDGNTINHVASGSVNLTAIGQLSYATDKDTLFVRDPASGSAGRQLSKTTVIVKNTTTTRTLSTTLAIDPELQTTLEANSIYWVEMQLFLSGTTAVGIRVGGSGGASFPGGKQGIYAGSAAVTTPSSSTGYFVTALGSASNVGGSFQPLLTSDPITCYYSGLWTTTTATVCGLIWAQINSSALGTSVEADSYMKLVKLA